MRPGGGVIITDDTVEMEVAAFDKSEIVKVVIKIDEVEGVFTSYACGNPLMFLSISTAAYQEVLKALKMEKQECKKLSLEGLEKLIVIVATKVTKDMRYTLSMIFSNTNMQEIEKKEANNLLMKTHPKK